ncbi:hypothetical protein C8R45DRAFT_1189462 [Mycena sanguinolenta]|nr:hypothetical protein C8R45DRAFT_1189462 [Mycena sanguinolenta]
MPHLVLAEIRAKALIANLDPALTLLKSLNDGFETPFTKSILNTALALVAEVQNVKRNKDECIQLMESIPQVLYAIVDLHIKSAVIGSVPPAMLDSVGGFTETLYKIHTYIQGQHGGSKIKNFFRQTELSALYKDCHSGLEHALTTFKIKSSSMTFQTIDEMQRAADRMHNELMELISTQDAFSDRSSSGVIDTLRQKSPRIAILGGAGMGKTSLAKAVLHHPDIAAKFEQRFFVTAESANTTRELAALIALHLGLQAGRDLTKPVVQYFSQRPSCLLVLDNLETPWEPLEFRQKLEEFLALLSDVPELALIITMRGAERPDKVRWTRPFLPVLEPLSDDAARRTFTDITDGDHDDLQVDQLLQLTDNMPLAVELIAALVEHEGCSNVLERWRTEKTTTLSDGYDRRSSLDASIAVSLSSPRMKASPEAKDLLSLLSILPDGLSNSELVQIGLPIKDPLRCKAVLLRTSLAYKDSNLRLKSLVPIREHMGQFYPPAISLVRPLRKHYNLLLTLYRKYVGTQQMSGLLNETTQNLANLHQILRGRGATSLLDIIPEILPPLQDHRLEALFIIETFKSFQYRPIVHAQTLIDQAKSHLAYRNDPQLELQFLIAVGNYYLVQGRNFHLAMEFLERALSLAQSCGDTKSQSAALRNIAEIRFRRGDQLGALIPVREAGKLAKLSGNLHTESMALRTEGKIRVDLGDYKTAIFCLEEAREIIKLCGLTEGNLHHITLHDEGQAHILKSEYPEAQKIHSRILRDVAPEHDPALYAASMLNLAEIGVRTFASATDVMSNLERARQVYQMHPLNVIRCETIEADLNLRDGDTSRAKALFQHCLDVIRGEDSETVSYCLECLGDITRWDPPDYPDASVWAMVFFAHAQTSKGALLLHKAFLLLGDAFRWNGDDDSAHNLYVLALEGFTFMDIHISRAACMLRLGDLAQERGKHALAVEFWRAARPLFERSQQAKSVTKIDSRLTMVGEGQKVTGNVNEIYFAATREHHALKHMIRSDAERCTGGKPPSPGTGNGPGMGPGMAIESKLGIDHYSRTSGISPGMSREFKIPATFPAYSQAPGIDACL